MGQQGPNGQQLTTDVVDKMTESQALMFARMLGARPVKGRGGEWGVEKPADGCDDDSYTIKRGVRETVEEYTREMHENEEQKEEAADLKVGHIRIRVDFAGLCSVYFICMT